MKNSYTTIAIYQSFILFTDLNIIYHFQIKSVYNNESSKSNNEKS